jgi:carboxyl-terminal processing protease
MKSKALSLMSMAALVAACGGGGGGGVSDSLPPSSTLAQQCSPANPLAPSANRTASLDTERRWVRSYVDEAYLWYREVPTVDATRPEFNLSDVPIALDNYFLALTEEGVARDRFSFTYPTADWLALAQSGIVSGFGAEWLLGSATPPRNIRIAYVDPQTPAAAADLTRGMALVSVDGFSADDNTSAGIERLNEALFSPTVGRSYSFVLRDLQGVNRAVSMTAAQITKTPVQNLRTIDTPSGRVGYMSFHDHLVPAEGQLVSAFQSLASQNISDLVLDLRYNGGGYLYIASQVGYMIAGSTRTGGRTFERLLFNDKRTADNNDPDNNTPFYNVTSGFSGSGTAARQPLPQLSLNRVFVLAGPGTCSASEAIVNGLRGINVEVVLIGGTTCGKPYGFTAKDNCGISYFPIEFQGVNDQGFGDYASGFAATCAAADDLTRALGDSSEGMLAAALSRRANGSCPVAGDRESPQAGAGATDRVLRHPARESKILR